MLTNNTISRKISKTYLSFYQGCVLLSGRNRRRLPPIPIGRRRHVQRGQHLLPQLNPASFVPHPSALQLPDGQQRSRLQLQRRPGQRIHSELHPLRHDAHVTRHSAVELHQAEQDLRKVEGHLQAPGSRKAGGCARILEVNFKFLSNCISNLHLERKENNNCI